MTQLRSAALTDIGRVRRRNEDRMVLNEKLALFGVADGVGGLPGGAEAAELALLKVTEAISLVDKAKITPGEPLDMVTIVQNASNAVFELGRKISPNSGIASTLTVATIIGRQMVLGHVGDSRCYTQRGDSFSALTTDHSVENEIRLRRAQGEDVYFHESNRHALTRCIGQPGAIEVDVIRRTLQARDRYLFCTDGVTGLVSDAELSAFLTRDEDPEPVLREIISLAIRRGGHDNATGVLLYIDSVA
ncbi:MAG: protein phosphatase 2C domain-containing protein [Cephaloticoccus sp.]|nr:protein phosphatase 2C domain-containing protein [Cephaloticoccus sp.]MCF7761453.1 protein phosphatase 2C domain-containing protein [Cephaloticoccus sp.]